MYDLITFKLPSFQDELLLSCAKIVPTQSPKAVVQLVHGMTEHKQRYLPFMRFLAANGYAAVIHDHRGHGASVRKPEDLGFFYETGAEGVLQDIDTVNSYIHENFPGLPVILLGHSMGSLAVRCYAARHDDCIDALLVIGTPAETSAAGAAMAINHADMLLHGPRHKSALFNNAALGVYRLPFLKEGVRSAWLNTDPAAVAAYEEDELCNFLFTADGWNTLFELLKNTYDTSSYRCTKPGMPILLLSGENDPCHGGRRGFYNAAAAMVRAGYRNVRTRMYSGMRHEILLEKEHRRVYGDILAFLRRNEL